MKPSALFKKPKDPKMKISIKVSDKTKYLCSNGNIVCGIVTRVLPWANGGATYFISHENGMVGEIRCDNPYLFGEDEVIPQEDEIDYSNEAGAYSIEKEKE